MYGDFFFFFFQAEDGIRDRNVTGVQTCALPIYRCRQATNLGYMIDGGCAEFVRAPEMNCLPYPENLNWEEAAAIPLVFRSEERRVGKECRCRWGAGD